MKKAKKFIISFCTATIAVIGIATSSVFALDVNKVEQKKSNWCWAACAEMLGKYENPTTNKDQYSVVKYLKGTSNNSYPNVGGTATDIATGAQYVADGNGVFYYSNEQKSYYDLNDIVNNYNNPIGMIFNVYNNGKSYGLHSMILYQVDSKYELHFYDPEGGRDYYVSYDAIVNGYSSPSNENVLKKYVSSVYTYHN